MNRHRIRTGVQRAGSQRVIETLPGVVTSTRRGQNSWINLRGGIGRAARLTLAQAWLVMVLPWSTIRAEDPQVVGPLLIKLIDQVEVPALEPGPIQSLDVRLGDTVKAGQVIARIDDRISEAQRELAATELAISRQRSSQYRDDKIAETESNEKEAVLQQQRLLAKIASEKSLSQVRVSAAEKAEAVAKNEWSRAIGARQQFADSVSDSELENLRLKYDRSRLERVEAEFQRRMDQLSAEGEVQGVKIAELAAQRAELRRSVAVADAESLRLDIESKQKTLQIQELTVARHRVASPIDGVVVEIYKRSGEWVRPGDSVVRVINLDQLHAEGFFSGLVRPTRGQRVRLSSADREVEGTIDFVSSERDSVSGEFRFLVRLDGGAFFPGDHVEIDW
ncbi:HlyD family efflux transporter periplasmic adaptor subunit [Stieleria sp. ICT_E10.1]|uniref:HlyD family secretion protein n=1 Tax=Stieleria sedimenti TaxID=2976331 RepID=UPI00218001CF|nr:HlyD family efflux transporter periplasmic adaptor subunit [Stieleria sedimenti]MCS7467874.1 HlyD family efflux transporter periplasmic adaptor subunit [Stieleria sedimenti]